MLKRSLFCAVVTLVPFAGSVVFAAAPASHVAGSMTVNGKKTDFRYVTAVTDSSMFFPDKRKDLVLVFSDVSVASSDVDASRLTRRWADGTLSALLLRIQPWDRQVISGNLWAGNLAKKGKQISGNGMANFLPSKFDSQSVEGRITQKKYGDDSVSLSVDVTFSAPISGGSLDFANPELASVSSTETKLTGERLPAGGGAPGAGYLAFVKALHAGGAAAIGKYLPAPMRGSSEEMKAVLPMLRDMAPKDSKITGGVSNGSQAELEMTSASGKGIVKMTHEKDGWKFNGVRPM
ncbi:MAG TPA: hypothetical protein VHL58_17490 [Thermoanaerobaculia bacterium]|nr:hypothetical protein [Thermoanaerobaculia bacterium]